MSYHRNLQRIVELEEEVSNLIYTDNSARCHFDYNLDDDHQYILTIITSNPTHKALFTLYNTNAYNSKVECLDDVIEYLKKIRTPDSGYFHYKIRWWSKNEHEQYTSYFSGKNLLEIIHKFYENKDVNDFTILEIVQTPKS